MTENKTALYDEVCKDSYEFGERRDCVVKALTIATGLPYKIVHAECSKAGRRKGCGMYASDWVPLLEKLWLRGIERVPQMEGKTVATFGRNMAQSPSTYVVMVRGHVLCFKNGAVQDWSADTRRKIRAVYRLNQ